MKAGTIDAVGMLSADHREVEDLFAQFARRQDASDSSRRAIVEDICMALTLHTVVEEDLFYPALRAAAGLDALLDAAVAQHDSARELVARLQDIDADEDGYAECVAALAAQVAHHVREEEQLLFPQARAAGLDLLALADAMLRRKEEFITML